MTKYYCDYCDIYLAHSSIGGRRQHCIGRRHIQNKIDFFQLVVRERGMMMMPPPFMMRPQMPPPPPPGTDPAMAMMMFAAAMKGFGSPPPPV